MLLNEDDLKRWRRDSYEDVRYFQYNVVKAREMKGPEVDRLFEHAAPVLV